MVGKPLEADGLGATEEEGAFEGLLKWMKAIEGWAQERGSQGEGGGGGSPVGKLQFRAMEQERLEAEAGRMRAGRTRAGWRVVWEGH